MLISLAVACLCAAAAPLPQDAPRPGFRRFETPGFAGLFEDALSSRLVLELAGEVWSGTIRVDEEWTVEAKLDGEVLVGEAKQQDGSTAVFRAEWQEAALRVTLGERRLKLHRLIDMPVHLTILGSPEVDEARQWTIAVYLGGDNNLEVGAMRDLEEMKAGMPASGVEVVVLLDRLKDPLDGPDDWSDTRVLRLRPGAEPDTIATPGELDTTSPEVLAGFVSGVFQRFPAPHHAVVIWDHGAGWPGVVSDDDRPSGRPDGVMAMPDIRRALRTAITTSLLFPSIDLIAFDACVMAHLEVAIELGDLAKVLVASQAKVAGTGFPYREVLARFAASTDAKAVAAGIVADFGKTSEDEHENDATLSAIDLRKTPAVARALDALALKCMPAMDTLWKDFARALFFAEAYQPRVDRLARGANRSVDLIDVVQRLRRGDGFPAANEIATLERAVADAVIANHHGEMRRLSHGLSVFGPVGTQQYDADYSGLWMGDANAWTSLLVSTVLHAAAMQDPIDVADLACHGPDGAPATELTQLGGGGVRATITGDAIVQVRHEDLVRDGERWWLTGSRFVADYLWSRRVEAAASDEVDLVMPAFVDGRNEIGSELLGVHFEVTNDAIRVPCTLDRSLPSRQSPWRSLARYRESSTADWIEVGIEFHHAGWNALVIQPLAPDGTAIVERSIDSPPATAEIAFGLQFVADDGTRSLEYGVPLAWSEGIALVLVPDAPGAHRVELVVETLDGRSARAAVDYTLVADPTFALWKETWATFVDPRALLGTWRQQVITGPEQWSDTNLWSELTDGDSVEAGLFDVVGKLGRNAEEGVTRQRWFFVNSELPTLRVMTEIADGRWYSYYGPAAFGELDGKRFIVMKPLELPGVMWRWEKQ
ncbi:MAG: hypothetical protein HZB39_18790 [Planctomycetes bacterium]|nr:hypothetical protein [Planctomycetota bacterium]